MRCVLDYQERIILQTSITFFWCWFLGRWRRWRRWSATTSVLKVLHPVYRCFLASQFINVATGAQCGVTNDYICPAIVAAFAIGTHASSWSAFRCRFGSTHAVCEWVSDIYEERERERERGSEFRENSAKFARIWPLEIRTLRIRQDHHSGKKYYRIERFTDHDMKSKALYLYSRNAGGNGNFKHTY